MGQDDAVTHRVIEHASVWSLQECSQTSHVMAARGQGGVRHLLLLSEVRVWAVLRKNSVGQ